MAVTQTLELQRRVRGRAKKSDREDSRAGVTGTGRREGEGGGQASVASRVSAAVGPGKVGRVAQGTGLRDPWDRAYGWASRALLCPCRLLPAVAAPRPPPWHCSVPAWLVPEGSMGVAGRQAEGREARAPGSGGGTRRGVLARAWGGCCLCFIHSHPRCCYENLRSPAGKMTPARVPPGPARVRAPPATLTVPVFTSSPTPPPPPAPWF